MNDENLKSYKPGQSGNPAGKSKGTRSMKSVINEVFNTEIDFEDLQGKPKKFTAQHAAVIAIYKNILKSGDVPSFKALAERLEGMPKQEVENTHIINKMPVIEINGKEKRYKLGS